MRSLIFMTIGLLFTFVPIEQSVSDDEETGLNMHDLFQTEEVNPIEELRMLDQVPNVGLDESPRNTTAYASRSTNRLNRASSTVLSASSSNNSTESEEKTDDLSTEKVDLLARLVNSEARGEPYEGKLAVAEVVLNRVESSEFPDSIEDVIYQNGQFQVVSNGSIEEKPNDTSVEAAEQALNESDDYAEGALFFYNYDIASNRWLDKLPTITVIGQHTFK